MCSKSCVYWIHTPDQTDIFTQGYVGVCKNGAAHRYKEHQSQARLGSSLPLHRAIRKYGTDLVVETIVYADMDYCYNLETKLRPIPNVGYNINVGGSSGRLGTKLSAATKTKMSETAKRIGTKPSQIALDNSAATNSKKTAWLCRFSNKFIWKLADQIYDYILENPNHGYRRISTVFGTTPDQLSTMYRKIKSGWNPLEDKDWLIFSSKLTPDTSGDKSLEPAISQI